MSFNVAATAYDRFMGRFSRPLASVFADWLELRDGARALDVGCGPGALTEVLADRLGADSVTGVDPSEPFVEAARQRLPGVTVMHASAEALPFDDGTFDLTVAQLVVHFLTDPREGVAELRRVTRRGGMIGLSVWDFEGGRAPQSLFFRALREVVPEADDETGRAGARRGDLVALLREAKCHDIDEAELDVEVESASFHDWWEPYTLGVGPAGAQFAQLSESERRAVRERCLDLLGEWPITTRATAWAAKGVR
jgi:ubiquinone/menaquinone biosynthesis C-methylase UbiE